MNLPDPLTFNTFDWILLGVLAWSTVAAFVRGILRVLFSFVGLFAGILLGGSFYRQFALAFRPKAETVPIADLAAFLLIAVASMIVFGLLGRALSRTARAIGLGIPDRLLGGLFGFARGCLLGVAVMMAVAAFVPSSLWVAQSRLLPYFLDGAHAVSFVVPEDLQERILKGADELKHSAPDWIKPLTALHNEARCATSLQRTTSKDPCEARTRQSHYANA